MSLEINVETLHGGCMIMRASGSIEHATHLHFKAHLEHCLQSNPRLLLVNLSQVTYISSSGIGVILYALMFQRDCKAKIVIVGMSQTVREALKTVGLLNLITSAETEDDAMKM